jgi:hypothetical protein
MRAVALVLLAACGGQPALANAPRPDPSIVAGAAAAIAGAAVLADPDAASRKPEKKQPNENQNAIPVKEHVPSAVFDRLDQGSGASENDGTKPVPAAARKKGPLPKLPDPKDAVREDPAAEK